MSDDAERAACTPQTPDPRGFRRSAKLPYSLTVDHIAHAMTDFVEFLGFINVQLHGKGIPRLETMLMPANFSSMVGEFMSAGIPKYCPTLVRNRYHNGHPDLVPTGRFPNDAIQYTKHGIEIKASRYLQGWQGHNPEECFLMIFSFDSGRPSDSIKDIPPRPFRFIMVAGAKLTKNDWAFAGRSQTSRRTITASVTKSGRRKMLRNCIYKEPGLQIPEQR